MKLQLAVYYADGCSRMIEIDKPPGAHPESRLTAKVAIAHANKIYPNLKYLGLLE